MSDKSFLKIFIAFFKVGTLLLGGGYVILPLLTAELVDKKKWISSDELCEFYALSTSLPGIIAANTAIFTGRKLYGRKGAIAAIVGVTLPAFIAIIILATLFNEIASYNFINDIFKGISVGVIILLYLAIKEMWNRCLIDLFSIFVFIFCLILSLFTKFSPAIIVIASIIIAVVNQKYKNIKENTSD